MNVATTSPAVANVQVGKVSRQARPAISTYADIWAISHGQFKTKAQTAKAEKKNQRDRGGSIRDNACLLDKSTRPVERDRGHQWPGVSGAFAFSCCAFASVLSGSSNAGALQLLQHKNTGWSFTSTLTGVPIK